MLDYTVESDSLVIEVDVRCCMSSEDIIVI